MSYGPGCSADCGAWWPENYSLLSGTTKHANDLARSNWECLCQNSNLLSSAAGLTKTKCDSLRLRPDYCQWMLSTDLRGCGTRRSSAAGCASFRNFDPDTNLEQKRATDDKQISLPLADRINKCAQLIQGMHLTSHHDSLTNRFESSRHSLGRRGISSKGRQSRDTRVARFRRRRNSKHQRSSDGRNDSDLQWVLASLSQGAFQAGTITSSKCSKPGSCLYLHSLAPI